MPHKKSHTLSSGPNPRGWAELRSKLTRHQFDRIGQSNILVLRDFLVFSLSELEKKPNTVSPKAYALLFDTIGKEIPLRWLSAFPQDVRSSFTIALGVLAHRSADEKSFTGRLVRNEYIAQLKQVYDNLFYLRIDDFLLLLQSELSLLIKQRILQYVASPNEWLHPNMVPHIRALLPSDEQEAFAFFPWSEVCSEYNQEMVRVFLPTRHALMDLHLSANDWNNRATVEATLRALCTFKQNPACVVFELPLNSVG